MISLLSLKFEFFEGNYKKFWRFGISIVRSKNDILRNTKEFEFLLLKVEAIFSETMEILGDLEVLLLEVEAVF